MGINERIEKIEEKLVEDKSKKFKLPFGKKVGKAQKKKNFVTLVKMNENGSLDFKKVRIEDQTFMEDDVPRLAAAGYVYYWKKNPFIFLPSWSVEPFSAMEHYQKSLINGTNTVGYRLLLARMMKEQVNAKKQMGGWWKWVLGIILLGVIVYAIFFTGGGN